MDLTPSDSLYIIARSAIVLLCLVSLLTVGREAWAGGRFGRNHGRTLACAAGLLLCAILLTVNDLIAALGPGDQMATYQGAWLWLIFDAGVPLLMIQALRLARQRDKAFAALETLSVTDSLTALANRRGFAQSAAAALLECQKRGEPAAVIVFDLDHFKTINDGHGHAAGDAVLREVAAALRREVRATDIAARLGGEEFVLLCPATTAAQAVSLAERVRAEIRRNVRHPAGNGAVVTSSAGVAGVQRFDAGAEPTLIVADRALYTAKAAGRDRVAVAAA